MEVLFFGNSKSPAVDFTLDPNEGLKIHSRECYCLDYSAIFFDGTLSWQHFFQRVTPQLHPTVLEAFKAATSEQSPNKLRSWLSEGSNIRDTLLGCTDAPAERIFLEQYINDVLNAPDAEIEQMPALVPQVWVSWLHYRPDDSERAKAIKQQPFRVDFVAFYKGRKLVFEIDGWSHISDNYLSIDRNGHPAEGPSLIKYTEHLKKDRWLRLHGWEVHRFSTLEVENEGANSLLSNVGVVWVPF